jgi:hypothetical protein
MGQFGQGNAAGGEGAAVEAVLPSSASISMNLSRARSGLVIEGDSLIAARMAALSSAPSRRG